MYWFSYVGVVKRRLGKRKGMKTYNWEKCCQKGRSVRLTINSHKQAMHVVKCVKEKNSKHPSVFFF